MRLIQPILWMTCFLILTGLALMFLYVPHGDGSISMETGKPVVTPGTIIRGIHFWAGVLIVLVALAHLARTVFVKTNHRYVGWAAALFVLILALSFTGFLLPWDQLTDWVHRMGGPLGRMDAQNALLVVYWTHALGLSVLTLPLWIVYARRTRRDFATASS